MPEPAIGDFDEAAEIELLRADLRDTIPGFDEGTNPEHRHHPGRMAAAACRRRIRPPAPPLTSRVCGMSVTL